MNSQKLLIIAVVMALLIIGGAIVFAKMRSGGTDSGTSATLADQVTINNTMTSCTPKDQCIIVDTKCSFCCNYVAINSKSEALYNQMFDQTCNKYSGSYCECSDLSSYPSCVNGTCQMVKWSENKAINVPIPAKTPPAAPQPVQPAADAFGESEIPENQVAPPVDDLYAPIPDAYKPAPVNDDVHVVQP